MDLAALKSLLTPFDACRVLSRSLGEGDSRLSAAALTLKDGRLSLWVAEHDGTYSERLEAAEWEDLADPRPAPASHREALLGERTVEPALMVEHCTAVTMGGVRYMADGSSLARMERDQDELFSLIALLQAGWEAPGWEELSLESLFLLKIDLQDDFSALPSVDGPLILHPAPVTRSAVQPVSLTVPFGAPVDIPLKGPAGERAYITGAELLDPWQQLEETLASPEAQRLPAEQREGARRRAEQIYNQVCPRGMAFPALLYETEQTLSLQFYPSVWLDSPIDGGGSGLAVLAGPQAKTGPRGLPLKTAVLTELPVPMDFHGELDIGALQWSRTRTPGDVILSEEVGEP